LSRRRFQSKLDARSLPSASDDRRALSLPLLTGDCQVQALLGARKRGHGERPDAWKKKRKRPGDQRRRAPSIASIDSLRFAPPPPPRPCALAPGALLLFPLWGRLGEHVASVDRKTGAIRGEQCGCAEVGGGGGTERARGERGKPPCSLALFCSLKAGRQSTSRSIIAAPRHAPPSAKRRSGVLQREHKAKPCASPIKAAGAKRR